MKERFLINLEIEKINEIKDTYEQYKEILKEEHNIENFPQFKRILIREGFKKILNHLI